MMETNEYNLFLKRYMDQVWQRGNLAALGKYVSTDCMYHDSALPGTLNGPEELAEYISHVRSAFGDWHFHVEEVIGEEDTIAVRWAVEGIHQGLVAQLPPSGRPVRFNGISLYRFRGNKISEAWNCWNRNELVKPRTVFCACGARLVALDDAALARAYRQHVDVAHQQDHYRVTDEQIRAVIVACAHEFNMQPPEPNLERAYGAS